MESTLATTLREMMKNDYKKVETFVILESYYICAPIENATGLFD